MTQNTANAVELIQNRIVGHGDVKPEELLANPLNFRRHPGNQMEALRGSMKELGWIKTILVNKTTGHVIDGHARVEEAMRQGLPTIPGTVVELTEDEERLALALLDPITEMAISDSLMLEALLAEVHTEDPALQSLLDQLRDTTTDNGIAEMPADLSDRPMLFNAIQIAEQIELAWPMPQNGEEVAAGLMTPAMAMGQFNKLSRGGKRGTGFPPSSTLTGLPVKPVKIPICQILQRKGEVPPGGFKMDGGEIRRRCSPQPVY